PDRPYSVLLAGSQRHRQEYKERGTAAAAPRQTQASPPREKLARSTPTRRYTRRQKAVATNKSANSLRMRRSRQPIVVLRRQAANGCVLTLPAMPARSILSRGRFPHYCHQAHGFFCRVVHGKADAYERSPGHLQDLERPRRVK